MLSIKVAVLSVTLVGQLITRVIKKCSVTNVKYDLNGYLHNIQCLFIHQQDPFEIIPHTVNLCFLVSMGQCLENQQDCRFPLSLESPSTFSSCLFRIIQSFYVLITS